MVDSNFLHSLDVPEICMYIFIQIKEYCILYILYDIQSIKTCSMFVAQSHEFTGPLFRLTDSYL